MFRTVFVGLNSWPVTAPDAIRFRIQGAEMPPERLAGLRPGDMLESCLGWRMEIWEVNYKVQYRCVQHALASSVLGSGCWAGVAWQRQLRKCSSTLLMDNCKWRSEHATVRSSWFLMGGLYYRRQTMWKGTFNNHPSISNPSIILFRMPLVHTVG